MSIKDNFPIVSPSLNLDFANTKVLDPRITFSRPTSAVYYDGQTVSLAEQNLVLQSQTFDNASWNKASSITVTSNASNAPDGTLTASALLETATTGTHFVYQTATTQTATVQNFSAYIKANGRDFATVGVSTSGTSNYYSVTINLTSGVITQELKTGAVGASGSAIVISVGGGWYRVSTTTIGAIYVIVGSASQGTFTSTNSGFENYLGDITKGIYAWGAQLEQRDTVTAYTPTTTQPITNYIPTLLTAPANTARFDHNPVTGESLGLLVEEQRTNLVTYSEDFSNAAWTKTALNLTSNTIIAPDGTLTGSKIASTSGTWQSGLRTGSLAVSNSSISVYAKASEAPILQIATFTYGNFQCYFDLTTGVSNGTAGFTRTMTDVGNGWWRCTVSGTLTAGGAFIFIPMAVNSGLNPAPIGQGIYIWGAQLEAGSFPTSYIKTQASQVTRSADSASMTGANFSDWYNPSEGTWVFNAITPTIVPNTILLASNISANQIYVSGGTGRFTSYSPAYATTTNAVTPNAPFIGAVSFNSMNNINTVLNGGNPASATYTNFYANQITASFGATDTVYFKRIAFYPQVSSVAQLQALTS